DDQRKACAGGARAKRTRRHTMRLWNAFHTAALAMVGPLLIAASAEADPMKDTFTGWCVATEIDADGDGNTASSCTAHGWSAWGPTIGSSLSETAPTGGVCDGELTVLEFTYTSGTGVVRFRKGDLLFTRTTGGTLCFDTKTDTFTYTVHQEVTVGTGRFEGATGSFTDTGSGVALAFEMVPPRVTHSASSGSSEGEIVLAP
ncbi:MAG: hypothetical protein JSU66_12175, partial [Deltaproteobacteria bacterium]